MELSRKKSMELCLLADSGIDIEAEYPDAYKVTLDDLGPLATDFNSYVSHVQLVLIELANLSRKSWSKPLERHEYTPFYGRAKFRSALSVFAKDPEKYKMVTQLIEVYWLITSAVAKNSTPIDDDDDEELFH
jgi:hypothetical protein